jgi:hypothetical protein
MESRLQVEEEMEGKRGSDHKTCLRFETLDAVDYRQSFKYMSSRNWRKEGEPHEPEFKGPELLSTALNSLGTKIELTVEQLCRNLHFTPSTFLTVTGASVRVVRGKEVEVIPIRAAR